MKENQVAFTDLVMPVWKKRSIVLLFIMYSSYDNYKH